MQLALNKDLSVSTRKMQQTNTEFVQLSVMFTNNANFASENENRVSVKLDHGARMKSQNVAW